MSAVTGRGEKLARRTVFLAAAGAGIVAAQSAATPPTPPPAPAAGPLKIGLINAQLALVRTKEGQTAQQELEKKLNPKAEQIKKQQSDLSDLQRRLDQGGNTMAAATKAELQTTIQSKNKVLQRDIQDFNDEEQAEGNRLMADLEEKMQAVVEKYAVDNGLSLILNVAVENGPVVWASNALDITQAIIDAYDKAAPSAPKVGPLAPKPPAANTPKPPATQSPKPPAASPTK